MKFHELYVDTTISLIDPGVYLPGLIKQTQKRHIVFVYYSDDVF